MKIFFVLLMLFLPSLWADVGTKEDAINAALTSALVTKANTCRGSLLNTYATRSGPTTFDVTLNYSSIQLGLSGPDATPCTVLVKVAALPIEDGSHYQVTNVKVIKAMASLYPHKRP